jgi:penicillin-binding protein A
MLTISLVPKDEVARRLFAQGDYAAFLRYDEAVHEKNEPADTALYRAAVYAMDPASLSRAVATLQTIDKAAVDSKKLAALQASIDQRRSGKVPWVLDRNGRPIAIWSAAAMPPLSDRAAARPPHSRLEADPDFGPLIDANAGQFTFGANLARLGAIDDVETTLDSVVQHAAKTALQNYRGAFVAIDPRTNEILAIVSNDPHGTAKNFALESQYEPGSIVKVLTGLNAIEGGFNVNALFPYDCKGELMIDGRHFGDWIPTGHGILPDLDEALAESCNVFFADLGLRLGTDRVRKFMNTAGFDQQTDLGIFKVPLGRFNGDAFNRFETAFMSIGLEHESVTALHVAMLASMMANRGVLTTPRLLRARRSILGEVTQGPTQQARARIASAEAAKKMVEAMVAVVARPKGTGRRADIEGVPLALKTGTAGERKNGYEAVIMAFAPVDSPKIAFGIIAEDAGPAEFAGAKIAHDFLEQIRDRLK